MIVADTNLIAYLTISGEYTEAAERILLDDPDWVAPPLWHSEYRNLVAVLARAKTITMAQARGFVRRAEEWMTERQREVDSEVVLDCIEESKLSAYDCEFIALARQLRVPLITADRRLVKAFPSIARLLVR